MVANISHIKYGICIIAAKMDILANKIIINPTVIVRVIHIKRAFLILWCMKNIGDHTRLSMSCNKKIQIAAGLRYIGVCFATIAADINIKIYKIVQIGANNHFGG